MRVLQVDKFLRRVGGGTAYMLDLGEHQRAAGHEVEFFAMAHEDNEPARFAAHFPPKVVLEPPPPGVAARVRAVGTMVWSRAAARGITEVIDEFRPDVIHLHNVYHQLSPSVLWAARRRGVPMVMTVHDFKLVCPSYRMLDQHGVCDACLHGAFWNAPLRRCKDGSFSASAVLALETTIHRVTRAYGPIDRFIAPSRFVEGLLLEAGVFPDRVRRIPHFFPADGLAPRTGPGDGVVFAGRLSREKGVDVLIDAMAMLPGARLTVAGEGPERGALEEQARRVAPGRVSFTGRLAKDEVLALLASARVACLPARYHENQPLSIIEAMGSGVPMVVTSLGGSPEMVDDGVDGAIVPPDDAPALAGALRRFLDDPDFAVAAGDAARRRVLRDYDLETHLRAVEGVYHEAGACRS